MCAFEQSSGKLCATFLAIIGKGHVPGARWQRDQLRSRLKIREPMRHVTAISTITAAVR
jgi:hypothetical protein